MEGNLKWFALWCSFLFIVIHAQAEQDVLSEPLNIATVSCDNTISKCQNGGRCISVGSQKFCKCRNGSSGPFCETVDGCKDKMCGKSTGTDVFCMYDQIKESAVCICKPNYYGFDRVEGKCRPTCFVDQDCGNGAHCLREGINEKENFTVGPYDHKYCRCLPGTSGKECEIVLSCDQDKEFCGKDAKDTCYYDAREQRAKCTCPVQGEAFDHSSKTCKECDCGKQSVVCSFLDGEKQCCCKTGFYDESGSCKECKCGDQGVDCTLQNGKKICTCKDGFYDVNGICSDCECGKSSTGCFTKDGNKVCKCKDGSKQNGAICDICDCGSKSVDCYYSEGEKKCTCQGGYVQKEDKCVEMCSPEKMCQNGGACEGGKCSCKSGTVGNFCENVPSCNNLCPEEQEGITCVYDQAKEKAVCKCPTDTQAYVKDEKKCKEQCDDDVLVCENHGKCDDTGEGRFCKCLDGTSGEFCQNIDKCETTEEVRKLCGYDTEVLCVYDAGLKTPVCDCKDGDKQFNDATKTCMITCDAKERPCANGGECVKGQKERFFCQCKDGTFGDLCEKITKCDIWHAYVHFCGGGANVNCSFDVTKGEPYCFCDPPNQKFNSKTKKCTITCDEIETLCVNEGKCVPTEEGKFCQCEEGFSDDLCEVIDVCIGSDVVPSYCGDDKNVECVLDDASHKILCICNEGEKEFDYNISRCRDTCDEENNRCKYGSCVSSSTNQNKFCACSKGFSGDFCEHVDECDKKCGNGNDVRCEYNEKGEDVTCVCKDGLKRFDKVAKKCRAICESDKDCKNSAKCSRIDGVGFCRCSLGITSGDFCELVDDCEDRKVDCGVGNGAICVFASNQKTGSCKCENEAKRYDEKTKKCINCDCGPLSYGCSLSDGSPWCQCDDGAYNNDNYCYDCNCGQYSDGCNYDQVLKEKTCQCHPGFSQNRDRCESCYCGPDSKDCKFTNGEINCTCNRAFIQKDDFCVPACNETHPCTHGAKCLGGFCLCKKGTGGAVCNIITACEDIDVCGRDEKVLCLYDDEREEAHCKCNGTSLLFDEASKKCVECDCGDKGVCSLENGKKKCDCIPTYGFLNGKCEECKCGEKAKSCSMKDGKIQCLCEEDFDVKQGICTQCGCGENSEGCIFGKDKITCKCKKAFSQHGTKCEACDCGENGTCSIDNNGKTTCVCKSGYALKNGKCVKTCSDNCKNGGSCKKETGGNFCSCFSGTSGDLCEVIDDCATVYKDCKENFGTCKYKVEDKKAYCECKEKTQYNDDLKRCRKLCSKEVPCENKGKCEDAVCKCAEGTSGDLCSTVDGCKDLDNFCKAGQGVCIYAPDKPGKAACGCEDEGFTFSEKDRNCLPIWCLENSCAASARCEFDGSLKVAYCSCDNKTAYYNHTEKTCNAVDSCIFSPECKKFEVCQNGKCICPENHKETNEGCKPDLCSLHKCANFKDAICKETDILKTVDCVCGNGLFYDGSQCSDGNCFIPGRWANCNNACPYGMEQTATGCQPNDKSKICSKSCGRYGFCIKEGGTEQCRCLLKVSEMVNGSCVLNATAVCASKRLTSDSSKCECSGTLKYAKDGITCEKRTCSDLDVQEECKKTGALRCENKWDNPGMDSGAGYECVCGPGYSKNENNICTENCKLKNQISKCAARGQICVMDHLYNAICKCPPTTAWNETTQRCDILNENVFMMQNLPVIKKKYLKEDGSLDKVMLNVDIVNAMSTVYPKKILDYAFLSNYSESADIIKCSVIAQFNGPTKHDGKRYTFYADLQLNCKDCSMYLLPPLLLDKQSFNDITLQSLDFCSEPLRNYLCGPGSGCKDKSCSCDKGYRISETSVQVADDFSLFRCEDIDECSEKTDECTKNTTCVNIPGSYFCNCKQGFKKLSDTIPYRNTPDKETCVDFCSPNPCKKGACRLKDKGFDCSCEVGYRGSLCDAADENLQKANTSSKVIGGVLGTLLAVIVIACLVFYYLQFYRKRTRNNSEGALVPTRMQADGTELAERSIGILNPLAE